MRLMITGRHVAVTPALREYVETRMERLDRYGLKLGTLQILLSLEKFHHVAEVVGVVQPTRTCLVLRVGHAIREEHKAVARLERVRGFGVRRHEGQQAERRACRVERHRLARSTQDVVVEMSCADEGQSPG